MHYGNTWLKSMPATTEQSFPSLLVHNPSSSQNGRSLSTADLRGRMSHMLPLGLCILSMGTFPDLSAHSAEKDALFAPDQFTRGVLMQRFDGNLDGKLDKCERNDLRQAFGRIDVPMFPERPYDYTQLDVSQHVDRSHLEQLDNTPPYNPTTNAGARLGRVLFYDEHLSLNNSIACASCHQQAAAFSDPKVFSVGFKGGRTKRNSMGLTNIRYTHLNGLQPGFFWDERAATLEVQVLMPIQDKIEMGMTLKELERKLQGLPYYPPLFQSAFGSSYVTSGRVAKAIAQFMRAMISMHSKFDAGTAASNDMTQSTAFPHFTAQENLGKSLFLNGAGGIAEFACAMCHVPPTFNMDKSNNIGLEVEYADPGLGGLGRPSNDPFTPSNDGKFKAPSLRNVELTAPYMHDGRFATLEQVVDHYSDKVHLHPNLNLAFEPLAADQLTSGFRFSPEQKQALVAFLKTLTDKKFVTDPRFSDPFIRQDE